MNQAPSGATWWPSARTGICRPDGAEILFWFWFYKDAAPTALGTNAVPKSFCDGRLGHLAFEFKPMANKEIYPAKLAEWATASHVEKHTPVPRAKPSATPAK
jgi:hypothetical protein